MPSLRMLESESPHNFATTTEIFEREVKAGGWTVLATHGMQAKLSGFGHDVDSVKIYGLYSSKRSTEIVTDNVLE